MDWLKSRRVTFVACFPRAKKLQAFAPNGAIVDKSKRTAKVSFFLSSIKSVHDTSCEKSLQSLTFVATFCSHQRRFYVLCSETTPCCADYSSIVTLETSCGFPQRSAVRASKEVGVLCSGCPLALAPFYSRTHCSPYPRLACSVDHARNLLHRSHAAPD